MIIEIENSIQIIYTSFKNQPQDERNEEILRIFILNYIYFKIRVWILF